MSGRRGASDCQRQLFFWRETAHWPAPSWRDQPPPLLPPQVPHQTPLPPFRRALRVPPAPHRVRVRRARGGLRGDHRPVGDPQGTADLCVYVCARARARAWGRVAGPPNDAARRHDAAAPGHKRRARASAASRQRQGPSSPFLSFKSHLPAPLALHPHARCSFLASAPSPPSLPFPFLPSFCRTGPRLTRRTPS